MSSSKINQLVESMKPELKFNLSTSLEELSQKRDSIYEYIKNLKQELPQNNEGKL